MRLRILKNYVKQMEEDTFHLSTEMLNITSTHMFIASHVWEEITIELDDIILPHYLHCISFATNNIKVKLPEKITAATVQQLTELFPSKSGLIRKAFMMTGDVEGVLEGCLV